eukprot:37528_1
MSLLNIWVFITLHVRGSNSKPSDGPVSPNIILILMDDLGFTDTSINGGAFPMVTLDELATNGIKLNYHYSNTLCSASRSSLLTGRYAWRTGVVDIVRPLTLQHANMDLPFIAQQLQQNDPPYHTAMYGKFHLGYSSREFLPFNRGFERTLFFEAGASQYSSHQACNPWFWAWKGLPVNNELRTLLMSKFIDGFCGYDLWDEHYHRIESEVYSEQLYTHNIIEYINENANNPFFIYYAMQTPHWPLEEPPKVYDECKGEHRKIFCNVLLYGDEMIGDIVNHLKEKDLYDDTVIMFMSDNGPNTNWANKGFGQSLPLRGAKGTTFEGGIRTPAVLSGGYVDKHCQTGRSYDDLVHISDWHPMIEHLAGADTADDSTDGVNLWQSICLNDEDAVKREHIMHFSMADATEKEQGFGPSYIRTDKWKLTVNASLRFDGNVAYEYWVNYDNEFKTNPPKRIFERMVAADDADLYESACYSAHIDPDFHHSESDLFLATADFGYDEIMLFKIDEDRIEACNVAQFYPNVVRNLYDMLLSDEHIEQYATYQTQKTIPSKQGALAQIESYDCETKKAYHLSWEELEGYDDEYAVKDMTWDDIFGLYVDVVDGCNMRRQETKGNHQMMAVMIVVSLVLSVIVILRYYLNYEAWTKKGKAINDMSSDVTPLLSVSRM